MEEDKGGDHDNNNKEDDGERETEGGGKRESEKADEKEKTCSGSTEDEEGNDPEKKIETELSKEEREPDLFTLSSVNAYGSQEVRKIEDVPDKVYTVTSKCIFGVAAVLCAVI